MYNERLYDTYYSLFVAVDEVPTYAACMNYTYFIFIYRQSSVVYVLKKVLLMHIIAGIMHSLYI